MLGFSRLSYSGYDKANKIFGNGSFIYANQRSLLRELIKDGYYFSVIPWVKEFLVTQNKIIDQRTDQLIDKMLYYTGLKPFEVFPDAILARSQSAHIKYILAKRSIAKRDYKKALKILNSIPSHHLSYPFVSHLKGVAFSLLGNQVEARNQFNDCMRSSLKTKNKMLSSIIQNQLELNSQYCLVGKARSYFGERNFRQTELSYIDISKDSFVWPQILIEEAWNSYYQKNYNRTLGKLVSYQAPIFDFIFIPEIEVLKSLSYYRMCLFDDAVSIVDQFYSNYLNQSRMLKSFVSNRRNDYFYFYRLMSDFENKNKSSFDILSRILKSIKKDPVYIELKSSLFLSLNEYKRIRQHKRSKLKLYLLKNIKSQIREYKKLIGVYIRSHLIDKDKEIERSFQQLSFIKLEVLAQRKERLYKSERLENKKRGDVKFIQRNDKQYFWNFNGEFWADELGDYVFALGSKC